MNIKHKLLYNRLEAARKRIISEVSVLSEEQLLKIPAPDKWSVLQIIFHLVKTEKITVISIKKHLSSDKKIPASGIKYFFNAQLLFVILKTKLKFKAPAIVASVPETYNFNDLLGQWEKTRKSLKETIENFPPEYVKVSVFTHPYSGNLNFERTLRFILGHLEHHEKQVSTIIHKFL